jgi:nitroimidazol reductase NimA-like FMN-containing flavoprotein (pyridoxamine 5'-phosphate oxidase superfamily)
MTTPRAERPAMSDYGVPDDLDGVLPWSWAEERLVGSRNLWVVSASAAGRPHAMPVWGVWVPDTSTFVFSCSPNARKVRNFTENPQVSVAVDSTVEVVVVEGTVRSVTAESVDAALDLYVDKYWETEQEKVDGKGFVSSHDVWELTPERAFGVIETEEDFACRATKWVW